MSNELNQRGRGVQILLDNQKDQHESLLTAALIARKLKLVLQGLFIEEENQIRAADLSFSREISLWSAKERQISSESVHRILRANARLTQKELKKVANSVKVDCSFQVIRGERVQWIKDNIDSAEILFLGGNKLVNRSFQSLKYCCEVTPPLLAVFDGSKASENAFKIAVQIAENNKKSLLVLLLVNDLSDEQAIKDQINLLIQDHPDIILDIETMTQSQFSNKSGQMRAHMLIIPRDMQWLQNKAHFGALIQQAHCPVVLVR